MWENLGIVSSKEALGNFWKMFRVRSCGWLFIIVQWCTTNSFSFKATLFWELWQQTPSIFWKAYISPILEEFRCFIFSLENRSLFLVESQMSPSFTSINIFVYIFNFLSKQYNFGSCESKRHLYFDKIIGNVLGKYLSHIGKMLVFFLGKLEASFYLNLRCCSSSRQSTYLFTFFIWLNSFKLFKKIYFFFSPYTTVHMPNVKYVYKCIRLYECFNNSEGDVEQVYATSSSSSWMLHRQKESEREKAIDWVLEHNLCGIWPHVIKLKIRKYAFHYNCSK